MKDILLLEDDIALAQTIAELLEENGYSVDTVHNGNDAIDATYENGYKLYIFDINVPDMDGITLLEALRNADDGTRTIFISALIDLETIAKAFQIGAEDYLKKPFFPEELLFRVDAKLKKEQAECIEFGDLRYDPAKKELYKKGRLVALGEVGLCLCDIFLRNIAQVIEKTTLYDCLTHPSDTALRVAINKLKQQTSLPIRNIRGIGYILEKS